MGGGASGAGGGSEKAALDPRFQFFHELPEDSYEAFLVGAVDVPGAGGGSDQSAASRSIMFTGGGKSG